MSVLDKPLAELVGGRTTKPLEKAFEIRTVGDLLRHYPRRMAERGELTDLASLRVDEDVTVMAEVLSSEVKGYDKGLRAEIVVSDGRGKLHPRLLRQAQHLARARSCSPACAACSPARSACSARPGS